MDILKEKRNQLGQFVKGHKHSEEVRGKISSIHKGKPAKWISSEMKEEIGKKISEAKKGKPHYNQRGPLNHRWKGGVTPWNMVVRHSLEYKLWRTAVFERDGYMCIWGGKDHGNKLQADHIKRFSQYPELRFAIDNGRTLCVDCHRKLNTNGRPKKHE